MSEIIYDLDNNLDLKQSKRKDTDWEFSKIVRSVSTLPKSVSLEKYLPPVKNQGSAGLCYAVAGALAKEIQENIEQGYVQEMSPLHIAKHVKAIDNFPNEEGSTIKDTCKVLYEVGSINEQFYPYSQYKAGSLVFPNLDESNLTHYKIGNYARCSTIDEMKQALASGKMFILGFQCLSGIYNVFSDKEVPTLPFDANGKLIVIGGHAVLVYGYDEKGLLFQNSWGEDWGFKGKARMPYEYLEFCPKDFYFSFLMDSYCFVDLENDPLVGTKIELFIDSNTSYIDGLKIQLDSSPYIDKTTERCLVPLRFISEILGYTVEWEDKTKKITIKNDSTTIYLWADGKTNYALVNKSMVNLDQLPVIKNDRTFVPVRFIAEKLGCSVLWDNVLRKVTILK